MQQTLSIGGARPGNHPCVCPIVGLVHGSICFLVVTLACLVGCKAYDPLYCDRRRPCSDPERPFCDLEGEYGASDGVKRTCIPTPDDMGPGDSFDAGGDEGRSDGGSGPGGGNGKEDGTPGGDAAACSWRKLFELANVNSGDNEQAGSFDSQGLTIYFARYVTPADGGLYFATRGSIGQAFSQPTLIAELSDSDLELDPEISPSGLEVFYPIDIGASIETAVRETPTSPFVPAPRTGLRGLSPALSGDALSLYFVDQNTIRRATRTAIGEPWSSPVTILPTAEYLAVDVSPDELRLLLTSAPDDASPLWIAERASVEDVFGTPIPIDDEILAENGELYYKAAWDHGQTQMVVSVALAGAGGSRTELHLSVCE